MIYFLSTDSVSTIDKIRAGVKTQTQIFSYQQQQYKSLADLERKKKSNVDQNRGLHESWELYDRCKHRENNKGKFFLCFIDYSINLSLYLLVYNHIYLSIYL